VTAWDETVRSRCSARPAILACRDANGRLLGAVDVSVASIALRVASAERGAVLVDRGTEATIAIDVDSSLEIPRDARMFGSAGFEVIEQTREGRALRVRVRVARDAPERGALSMAIGDDTVPIAALDISVRSARSIGAAPDPLSPAQADPVLPQAFALVPSPSIAGVRDLRRAGLGVGIAGAIAQGDMETRGRGAVDVRVGLLERQFQLEVAMAATSERMVQHQPARIGRRLRRGGLCASVRLARARVRLRGVLPHHRSEGRLEVVRLLPSVHAALTILPQLFFRARLGAFADLDGSGNAAFCRRTRSTRASRAALRGRRGRFTAAGKTESSSSCPPRRQPRIVDGPLCPHHGGPPRDRR
jgi:hypothetical protein